MSQSPLLSIIVPTHNRSDLLAKSLAALSGQTWPATEFELIVVGDSCDDDTAEMVTAYSRQAPYRLHFLCHNARSAAATRNLGAAHAQGSVFLFLDDDVVAQPGLVRAHMEAQHPAGVVLGYSKPALPPKPNWWQYDARRWWEDSFRTMGQVGHRFSYRDFFSGNVSLPAALFHKVGGFDASFAGRLEDYEFGLRLLKAGARFRYVPEAIGYHHENTDLGRWLRRVRQEGMADIQIGQRNPELRTTLFPSGESQGRRMRLMHTLAFAHPSWGDWAERPLLRLAALYEQIRWRGRWRLVVSLLREYNYWRGVATAIGGRRALTAWLQEAPMPPAVAGNAPCIDLAMLPPADVLQGLLEQAATLGLRLALEGVEVLAIAPQPGAEPLRQEHLHTALQRLAEQQFVPPLALHLIHAAAGGSPLC